MNIRKRICLTLTSMAVAIYSLAIPVAAQGVYTVKEGDNLSKISAFSYGNAGEWKKIYESNRETIKDPNVIAVGMVLNIPDNLTAEGFYALDGKSAYNVVKNSKDSWVVTSYDLVTPENIKEVAVASAADNGFLGFNLAWPPYGGYEVSTIKSLAGTSGIADISRIGGNGGYSICFGTNQDGTPFTASQRAIPSSSISYRTGNMNIDLYKAAIDAITSGKTDADSLAALKSLGFSDEISVKMISDYKAFFNRSEMAGKNNIMDGIKLAGNNIDAKYGFYGLAAPWKTANLDLEGGSTQMTITFSFGTMIDSGIITDVK